MQKILSNKKIVFTFLIGIMTLFLLIGFSFGDQLFIYCSMGLCIVALLMLLVTKSIKVDNLFSFLFICIPFLAYGVIISLCRFASLEVSLTNRIFIPISMVMFSFIGYLLSLCKVIKVKDVVLAILIGVALYSLVNLIITLSKLGPFYGYRYSFYYSYYGGVCARDAINKTAYILQGFSIKQCSIEYFMIYPVISLVSGFALICISPKQDLKRFIIIGSISLIGLVAFILTINKFSIVVTCLATICVGLFTLLFKLKILGKKVTHIISLVVLILVSLFIVSFIINAQSGASWMHQVTSSNKLFNFIYNSNGYSQRAKHILNGLFSKEKLFGFPYYIDDGFYVFPSGLIVFDQIMYGGIFGFLFFIVICVISFIGIKGLVKNSKKEFDSYLITMFVIAYFAYELIGSGANRDLYSNSLHPYFIDCLWCIIVCLVSYSFCLSSNKEVSSDEK